MIDGQFEKCRKILKESINHKRYMHSLGVSDTAACLAMRYGYDIRKAALAGLIHDCAKSLDEAQLFGMTEQAGIDISPVERENPELLHSKAGSVLAREKYDIDDEEILSAVFYHTTGRPGMTLLEKIIYIADYIEPNRTNIPYLDEIRRCAFTDIDKAVACACKNSIEYLKRDSRLIDRITVETYEYYRNKCND